MAQAKTKKQNSFVDKVNGLGLKTLSFVRGDEAKGAFSKVKASLFAIIIGLVIGIIPIMMSGGDALTSYVALFTKPFNEFKMNSTLIYIAVFILIGAGIGVSFKTGLFNIGAAGQMLMAGAVTTMIGIKMDLPKGVGIPLLIIIAMLVGAFTASISGFLKAQFNVHEVVSTILLNWIIFYLVKYIFLMEAFKGTSSEASQWVFDGMKFDQSSKFDVYVIVIIAIALVAILGFVMKYTTFGFKLRMNGLNGDAAEYAGVNKKVMTISSMAISGAFIGLGGFIYYSTIQGQMPALGDSLPTIAFEAITVTLLAFSSPLGAVIAGAFYGIIYNGSASAGLEGNVPKQVIDLVIGIIVFSSALAPILVNTKIYRSSRNTYLKWRNKSYINDKKKLSQEISKVKADFGKQIAEESVKLAQNKGKIAQFHTEWSTAIAKVDAEFKAHKIDIIKRDQEIREINKKFKKEFTANGFDHLDHLKSERKSKLSSMKKEFAIKTNVAIQKYETVRSTSENKKEVRSQWVGGKIW